MTCRDCGEDFAWFQGKMGYFDQCSFCAQDVPILRAEMGEGDDGSVESIGTRNLYVDRRPIKGIE